MYNNYVHYLTHIVVTVLINALHVITICYPKSLHGIQLMCECIYRETYYVSLLIHNQCCMCVLILLQVWLHFIIHRVILLACLFHCCCMPPPPSLPASARYASENSYLSESLAETPATGGCLLK